jgi:hypothetical protein
VASPRETSSIGFRVSVSIISGIQTRGSDFYPAGLLPAEPAARSGFRPCSARSVPMVWVSDMLGSQRGHAVEWQVCMAHLLRDATYAIECGDTAFSAAFK